MSMPVNTLRLLGDRAHAKRFAEAGLEREWIA